MSHRLSRPAAIVAALALAVVASPVAAADDAMVRVLHASPDAPAVDVYVDGNKFRPARGPRVRRPVFVLSLPPH